MKLISTNEIIESNPILCKIFECCPYHILKSMELVSFKTDTMGLLFFAGPTRVEYTVQLAAIVITLVPTVIFYLLGQKYLENGINIGEMK